MPSAAALVSASSRSHDPDEEIGPAPPELSAVSNTDLDRSQRRPIYSEFRNEAHAQSASRLLIANDQTLPVSEELRTILPDHGLRRGSTIRIKDSVGATSLAISLLAEPLDAGSWAAVIGLPGFGIEAASNMGVPLGRLALVPHPGSDWREITAALLDSIDLVLLTPPIRCRAGDARKLAARARQRRSVLVICPLEESAVHASSSSPDAAWPESADIDLAVTSTDWLGLRSGHGRLRSRTLSIAASGRRLAGPIRRANLSFGW